MTPEERDRRKHDRMIREFLCDRPDCREGVVTLADGRRWFTLETLPQFALWMTMRGYADGDALGTALDIQRAANDYCDARGW